jgi:hypothetical protein
LPCNITHLILSVKVLKIRPILFSGNFPTLIRADPNFWPKFTKNCALKLTCSRQFSLHLCISFGNVSPNNWYVGFCICVTNALMLFYSKGDGKCTLRYHVSSRQCIEGMWCIFSCLASELYVHCSCVVVHCGKITLFHS